MKYPESRLRRLRYNKNIRSLVQDVEINISDLIYPIFVCEGNNVKNEIESLKGQYRLSTDNVIEKCEQLIKLGIKSILLFGKSSPVVASSIGGWVDNISVSSIAKYSDTFTPAQAVGSNKTVSAFCYKLDREQTKTGTYTLNTVQTGMQIQVAAAVNDFTFNTQVITSGDWTLGPAGLQILDYADVVSNNVEGTYSFTSTDQIYETRTATIPTPLGRKLLLSTTVIPKFYIRDAIYQSIDTVKTVTFNQTANFTKGSILQQYSFSSPMLIFVKGDSALSASSSTICKSFSMVLLINSTSREARSRSALAAM